MIRKNAFLSLLLFGGFFIGCKNDTAEEKEISTPPIQFKKEAEVYLTRPAGDTIQHLQVEIADDDYQRETGLMYRQNMAPDEAMLFIFEKEEPRGFYMKNTHIPLDIIFLDANNKVINIVENTEPQSMTTIPSAAPAKYVLEINAGLASQWNLQQGDSLILKRD